MGYVISSREKWWLASEMGCDTGLSGLRIFIFIFTLLGHVNGIDNHLYFHAIRADRLHFSLLKDPWTPAASHEKKKIYSGLSLIFFSSFLLLCAFFVCDSNWTEWSR